MAPIDPVLESEYNNRAKVPDHPAVMAGWKARSEALRAAHPSARYDVRYGAGPRNVLDIFDTGSPSSAPLVMFIHGGYWQALDKSWFSHLAAGFNGRGIGLAVPSYSLCPQVRVAEIVAEMRQAAAFLLGARGRDLYLCGHSAGGHLAAMLLASDLGATTCRPGLSGACTISGLFDLEPLIRTSINTALRLDAAEAAQMSPVRLAAPAAPIHAFVGSREGPEYLRQSVAIATAWRGLHEEIPDVDHFSAIEPLEHPGSRMMEVIDAAARLGGR